MTEKSATFKYLDQTTNKLPDITLEKDKVIVTAAGSLSFPNFYLATDIVACTETGRLYIAESLMGDDPPSENPRPATRIRRLQLDSLVSSWFAIASSFSPDHCTLSIRSRRLLVTSGAVAVVGDDPEKRSELILFGADGAELRRVSSPAVKELKHAVETSRETFIVAHRKPSVQVSEVDIDWKTVRVYSDDLALSDPIYLALDPDDRVFVADNDTGQVLLLNNRLKLEVALLGEVHQPSD